ERADGSFKEQHVQRRRFESLWHASHAIGDWIHFYNHWYLHQALAMKTLVETHALAT
ncbi:MAG: integrase core domain-containing protein, partial [Xanthomonadaceae bacterium]|nr:integrase core domain-containing protein [Xanthomonadaceae bacterium]